MIKSKLILSLIMLLMVVTNQSLAAPYEWNYPAPSKTPAPSNANGKTVLFDVSHGGTEGNADWVIDGGFSDFADALVAEGYVVEEFRGVDLNSNGIIDFHDDLNIPSNGSINEAVITYDAISHADVLVLAETNRPFKASEYQALEQFVAAGKGIFFIADHYNADRNLNTWDATEVFNGYNRSTLAKYNIGGDYGDLRNPGTATGWLVDNFGIRFRFNSIDYLSGVSGVKPAADVEGLTTGVGPVLMAAGATLAIIDPAKAKGLVYFSSSDSPTAWRHANDAGLYYGGENEGPYVAIAKSGAGKAAFIGDSSPIEDASPKYRRQDNGNTKRTYPGWTDAGNAAQLSINIVNWLATPESYTSFDNTNGHTSGFITPNAVASTEQEDPDNGQPWSQPSGGYDPWDTSTFANGSYGARFSLSGDTGTGTGTGTDTSTAIHVTEALSLSQGTSVVVKGQVTAAVNGIYALKLTDLVDGNSYLNIKLESHQRNEFSPELNPDILNESLEVTGVRDTYMSEPSVESVSSIRVISDFITVEEALAQNQGTELTVEGIVTSGLNDIYGLILSDESGDHSINVKLESEYRDDFSPELNPSILNHRIRVSGVRDTYMSGPSIESINEMVDLGISDGTDTSSDTDTDTGSSSSIDVTEALNTPIGEAVIVDGIVADELNGIYALLLSDKSAPNITINVKLESEHRDDFSPNLNPEVLNKHIQVTGVRDTYMSGPSIEQVSEIIELTDSGNQGGSYSDVGNALSSSEGTSLQVEGFIKEELNGIYGLLLEDTVTNDTINVKLESEFRNQFNPQLNPSIVGTRVVITGVRDQYMGQPGLRQVSDIQILN